MRIWQFVSQRSNQNSPIQLIVDETPYTLHKNPIIDINLPSGDHLLTVLVERDAEVAVTTSYLTAVPQNTNSTLTMEFLGQNPMHAKEGVVVQQEVRITNSGDAMGMVTAVVGEQEGIYEQIALPSGVEVEMDHMKTIQEKGTFDYFEIQEGDLIVYWESVPAKFERVFQVAMIPLVPGLFNTPASYVYEYYNKENIYWVPGMSLSVD